MLLRLDMASRRSRPRHSVLVRAILATIVLGAVAPAHTHAQFTALTTPPLGDDGFGFGVAWGDYDDDGDEDLYVANDGPDLLIRNDGDGHFSDATVPLFANPDNSGTVIWGDYDNDGDLDLYVVNYFTSNRLFRNEGGSVFSDATSGPLAAAGPGQGAAWADYDGDGDLDLYLVNYGVPNRLFRNDGGGTFSDVTTGPLGDAGWGLAAAWGDYDSDGDPDLYITNDGPNRLLRNDGSGVFTRVTGMAIEDGGPGQGAAWGDYDNDGDLDLYVANWGTPNKLIRNDGGDTFTQITTGPLGDRGNGTGVAWGDFDNDRDLDLYIANYGSADRLLRNDGGDVFTALTDGPLGNPDNGTGVAWADYDGDGDLDLYLVNDGQSNVLLRNDLASGNHWLELHLIGETSNRSAIGARIRLVAGGMSQIQEVAGGSGYMSQNSLTVEFGLGSSSEVDSILVRWPSGHTEVYAGVVADQELTLREMRGTSVDASSGQSLVLDLAVNTANPAPGAVRLRFAIPRAAHARLAIYNVQGRLVQTPVDAFRSAGWNEAFWDGCDSRGVRVSAGVYVAKLEVLADVRTRKLVLLR